MRGMAEDNDLAERGKSSMADQPGDEDMTSNIIRDEAIITWKLGVNMGITSQRKKEQMVTRSNGRVSNEEHSNNKCQ